SGRASLSSSDLHARRGTKYSHLAALRGFGQEELMATAKKKQRNSDQPFRPEGQIRQSQMVTTFGPGAMVDLLDRSIVIGGLEHWSYGKEGYIALDDARLRASLVPRLKMLDPNLDLAAEGYFRMSPEGDDN